MRLHPKVPLVSLLGLMPVLQEIDAQHPLDADRRAAIARLRIERLDQAARSARPSWSPVAPAPAGCDGSGRPVPRPCLCRAGQTDRQTRDATAARPACAGAPRRPGRHPKPFTEVDILALPCAERLTPCLALSESCYP